MSDEKKITMTVDDGAAGTRKVKVEYPSNSHKVREEKEEPTKKINKVISGTVVTKKKSFVKKLKESLFGDDVPSVSSYILYDVLIPAAKDTLEDLVKGSIEVLLRGEVRGGSRSRRDKGRNYTSYSAYYKPDKRDDRDRRDDRESYRVRSRYAFDDIILETKTDAEEVINQLAFLIDEYGTASVSDLYDLIGKTGNFTDNKYGWDNLSSATAIRVRGGYGYLLDLPKPILLD